MCLIANELFFSFCCDYVKIIKDRSNCALMIIKLRKLRCALAENSLVDFAVR